MQRNDLITQDLQYIWHPCSQMQDYAVFKPAQVISASGSYLTLADGKQVIDAIASWWCKSLGHGHPRLKQALNEQLNKFEHVIFANTTNDVIVELAAKLSGLLGGSSKVFFAGDGSSAVEIALKLSIHVRQLMGQPHKTKFVVLKHSYHGETLGALSLTDLAAYKTPYSSVLFEPIVLADIPYVYGTDDPVWDDATCAWETTAALLTARAEEITAIIVEPIVQGAAGMRIYSQDFLSRLSNWAKQHEVHFIADEIMTGIGRTGKMLACEHADIVPDIACLSKGLTSGWLPFSAVLVANDIYQLFYQNDTSANAFLHSHTYSGNALASAVALATLKVIEEEDLCAYANKLGSTMQQLMLEIANQTKKLTNVRYLGAIAAADIVTTENIYRLDVAITKQALEFGAILRPLGKTLYWAPPLNTAMETLEELKVITQQTIQVVC